MLKSKPEGDEACQARLECVTQDTTASLLSVQTDTSGQRYFIAGKSHAGHVSNVTCHACHVPGLALDTSLLTLHDTDWVDNLSDRNAGASYKLPPASSRLIINGSYY